MKTRIVLALVVGAALGLIGVVSACFAGKWDWQTGSDSSSSSSTSTSPKPPRITRPIMFNEPDADAILARMQVFPKDNPWNWDILKAPLLKNSKQMIATIGANEPLAFNWDMNFIIVPPDQKRVPVRVGGGTFEFPVPNSMPIEGWPVGGGDLATYQQQNDGDRHAIVVDPINGMAYEFYQARRTNAGWEAAGSAVFNLKINEAHPKGNTGVDAAGLPIFPSIVRFDECERGMVNHAMRFTVKHTRNAFVYPATHRASSLSDPNLPRMGERFRLRRDFDISHFSPHTQAVLKGLMKYGMFVADNGGNWRMSVAPDKRIHGLQELRRVKGSDFEVVDTSGQGGE